MAHIEITSDEQWHALRAKHIGGSDVAALFGLSPYTTLFSLWHEKAGLVAPDTSGDQKMNWGKLLEPAIAGETARNLQWSISPSKMYWTHDEVDGMGCTLDFDIYDHQWGPGICETKVVYDYADYKRDWSDERAPPHYELQVQHQLAVTGRPWCAIAVWIAQTATLAPPLIRRPQPLVISEIYGRITAFWDSIAEKRTPDPTGTEEELAIMRHLWPARVEKKVVDNPDPRLNEAASLYRWSAGEIPGLAREKARNKAILLAAAKDAELLRVPNFNIRVTQNVKGAVKIKVIDAPDNGIIGTPPKSTLNAG